MDVFRYREAQLKKESKMTFFARDSDHGAQALQSAPAPTAGRPLALLAAVVALAVSGTTMATATHAAPGASGASGAMTAIRAAGSDNRPSIPLLAADTIAPRCETGLADLRARVKTLEALPPARPGDARKVFGEWNMLQIALEDLQGPVDILNNVSPDKAVRDNADPAWSRSRNFPPICCKARRCIAALRPLSRRARSRQSCARTCWKTSRIPALPCRLKSASA